MNPRQPHHGSLYARLAFDDRFIARRREGEKLDANRVSLLVTTLQRTASGLSQLLGLGVPQLIESIGRGEAMSIALSAAEIQFDWWREVVAWADFVPELRESTTILPDYPLVPSPPEIRHLLEAETALRSVSFQRLASGNWEHATFDAGLPILSLEKVAMMMLQIDLLCREQGYPRGRFHLACEHGSLWFWVSELENLMLALAPNDLPARDLQLLVRCGEAFQLT